MDELVNTGTVTTGIGAARVPTPIVHELNEYTIVFYVGRGLTGLSPYSDIPNNWVDRGSWALGACTYAIHREGRAVVYDSMMTPEGGEWVRDYLTRELGITHFTLVLSHWHLDHIAGNPSYRDGTIVGLEYTRDALLRNKALIETGMLWGPPEIEVVLPNVTFLARLDMYLGDLRIEFHHFNIHSQDGNLMYIPADGILFAGDTLEDPITFMTEPQEIPTHIIELDRLRNMAIDTIYPNHGDLDVIRSGGYTKSFIDAIKEYNTNMLRSVREPGFFNMSIEESIPNGLTNSAVSIWEPYRAVHELNLKLVHDSYGNNAALAKRYDREEKHGGNHFVARGSDQD